MTGIITSNVDLNREDKAEYHLMTEVTDGQLHASDVYPVQTIADYSDDASLFLQTEHPDQLDVKLKDTPTGQDYEQKRFFRFDCGLLRRRLLK